jgi:hypothetical protein
MLSEEQRSKGLAALAIAVLVAVASLAAWPGTHLVPLAPAISANAPKPCEGATTNCEANDNNESGPILLAGRFVSDHKDEITAISTALLAIITAFLVYIARSQYVTTQAQLRAYVFVFNGQVSLRKWEQTSELCCLFEIELKNFGQTPARDYTTWVNHAIGDANDIPFTRPPPITNRQKSTILGPSASTTWNFARKFNVGELDEIRAARKAMFVWGGCDYRDVFGKPHYFIFRFKMAGRENQGIWKLRPHDMGEEGD